MESGIRQRQQGLAIVEYVIVAPLCLLLIMATGEFGRAFLQYSTLTQAVHEGARHVASRAVGDTSGTVTITPELETEAKNLVVYGNALGQGMPLLPGLSTDNVTVSEDGAFNVSVVVSYTYGSIFVSIPRLVSAGSIDVTGYTFRASMTVRALAL